MAALTRSWFALTLLLCATADNACAQTNVIERAVKAQPGREVRVGVYTAIRPDCTSGPLPGIRLADRPAHGTVSVKRAMLKATNFKQCLAVDVPAFVAFYRAAANYSGDDAFELEISFPGGDKQTQRFRVAITNNSEATNDSIGGKRAGRIPGARLSIRLTGSFGCRLSFLFGRSPFAAI